MSHLTEQTIRGGFAKVCAQGVIFVIRIGSLMVLARLLTPAEFGLVGMVMAVIGILNLFKDFGLSTATVQRASVTDDQVSALFWVNILVGAILTLLSVGMAPLVARFYHEPRLFAVTVVLAAGFLINALGVQHGAILQRRLRFSLLALIDFIGASGGAAVALGMALMGFSYWALVAMTLGGPLIATVSVWLAARWKPGVPRWGTGIGSMVRFGGAITLNGVITYVAYNLDKVLLGRYWGPTALGLYGRAYQLVNVPTENLNSAVGGVAFAALSRIQDDAERLKSYFLKGYSLILTLTMPITLFSALFANDLILILLGPKWKEAIPLFRLLAPIILIFGLINPLGWLLLSLGMVARSLKIALLIAPIVIAAYAIGLPHGPAGVALAYSAAMLLLAGPVIAWAVYHTPLSLRDVLLTVGQPLIAGVVACGLALAFQRFAGARFAPLPRLAMEGGLFVTAYATMLLGVMGQMGFYLDLVRSFRGEPRSGAKAFASSEKVTGGA